MDVAHILAVIISGIVLLMFAFFGVCIHALHKLIPTDFHRSTIMDNKNITDDQMNELLAKSPAPRVTPADIEARIEDVTYQDLDGTTTLCTIEIDNGFLAHGMSACVNPENYNEEIGHKIAYDNAFRQLWPLFGFLLAESNLTAGREATEGKPDEAEKSGKEEGGAIITDDELDKLKEDIEKTHKDSGVMSDVTQAVHRLIDKAVGV